MNILDFLMQNPVQMQQLAASADPAPVLASLDKLSGQQGTYGLADVIMPQQPPAVPMPMDPAAVMQNAPLYQNPQPQPQAEPKPTAAEKQKEALKGINRSAELASAMSTERPQVLSPGSPAGGRGAMNMAPVFQAAPAQAPISLAQLLFGGR